MQAASKAYIAIVMSILVAGAGLFAPALAFASAASPEHASLVTQEKASIAELNEQVKESRLLLLETRLDVVRKASEAKLRLDEMIKGEKVGAHSAEALRKDLDTIKEAQRVLATVLSDIVSAKTATGAGAQAQSAGAQAQGAGAQAQGTLAQGAGAQDASTQAQGTQAQGAGVQAQGTQAQGAGAQAQGAQAQGEGAQAQDTQPAAAQSEAPLSREYLESLISLYHEKTQQLVKIAASLDKIVIL